MIGRAVPPGRERETSCQSRRALRGIARVVALEQLVLRHVEDFLAQLRAQPSFDNRGRQTIRCAVDVVDGRGARLDHVDGAEVGEIAPLLRRQFLLAAKADAVERDAAGRVVGLAAKYDRRRVAVCVDETGKYRVAARA